MIKAISVSLFLFVNLLPAHAEVKLLVIGDSLTSGYGLTSKDGFIPRLKHALKEKIRRDITIINAGVAGDTTSGGLARLEWLLKERPDAVIIALGSNDALRGIAPKITQRNLQTMIMRLQEDNLPVLLIGARSPPSQGPDYESRFNSVFPLLAEQFSIAFYPFFLEGVALRQELNQADGIHPNKRGVALIVERLAPLIESWLRSGIVDLN